MNAVLLSATGNRFAALDAFEHEPPSALEEVARRVCSRGKGVDGLLVLLPPSEGGDCRMLLHNPDGSRPEACGNGLRCIAKLAVERGHVAGDALVVETDAGMRRIEVCREDDVVRYAWAEMGMPRLVARDERLATSKGSVHADLVDMGNPHCVLFVDDVEDTLVEELGPELERHAHFANRSNVEFVEVSEGELAVRIWERGVGETASCGSGVSAAAVSAIIREHARSPVDVRTRGGQLRVEWDGQGILRLGGPIEDVGDEVRLEEGA